MIGKLLRPEVLDLREVGTCEHCIATFVANGLTEGEIRCQPVEAVLLTEEQIEALASHWPEYEDSAPPTAVFGVSIWRPA